jgi:hypothetical protein
MEVVMKLFKITVAMVLLLAASVAVAGKGGPIISGYWEGSGQAIYPDGTIADIVLVQALLSQNGNFIHGGAEFAVIIGDGGEASQEGQMSGHLSGNALTGVLGGCFGEAPNCISAETSPGADAG